MPEKRLKPLIIPIFIPHLGCPYRCVFCDQRKITSQSGREVDRNYVERVLNSAVDSKCFDPQHKPEVAFYGGTFTGISYDRMLELLEAVSPYIKDGLVVSIRVSTRPDTLDKRRLEIMKEYGVETVELGAQSMDNMVLKLSNRGHTADDTVNAVQLLRDYGFRVGIQLMPGLPGDSKEIFFQTTEEIIGIHPDMVRLYPAVVIRGTGLERLYKKGEYRALDLDEAVEICADSCVLFESKGIPVIRIGLMSSPQLLEKGRIIAGPWHPAFGFLVRSMIYQRNIRHYLPLPGEASLIKIFALKQEIPLLRGYRNQAIREIEAATQTRIIGIGTDETLSAGSIRVVTV